jgi:hypothetical protein
VPAAYRPWAIGAAAWLALTAGHALSMAARNLVAGLRVSALQVSVWVLFMAAGALLTPIVLLAFRRWVAAARSGGMVVVRYVGVGLAFWLAWALLAQLILAWVLSRRVPFEFILLGSAFISLTIYAAMALLDHTRRLLRTAAQQQMEAARLEAEIGAERAAALQARLNPGLLFEALESAGALSVAHPRRARQLLADLGALLRAALDTRGPEQVALREEIELLRRYLAIRRARPGQKLRVAMDIATDALPLRLPRLLLSNVMEAFLDHSAMGTSRFTVAVRAARDDGDLVVTVAEAGPTGGTAEEDAGAGGRYDAARTQLANARGAAAALVPERTPRGGNQVLLRIPQRAEAAAGGVHA